MAALYYAVLLTCVSFLSPLKLLPQGRLVGVTLSIVLALPGLLVAVCAAVLRAQERLGRLQPVTSPSAGFVLLLVLMVFPLGATVAAIMSLPVVGGLLGPRVAELVPGHPGWTVVIDALSSVGVIGMALGLVSVLLRLSGEPGLAVLGLDRSRPSLDLRRGLLVLLVTTATMTLGGLLVDGLQLPHYAPPPQHGSALYLVASAVKAGLVEEVCLLGLPVWCGRRLGWSTRTIVAVAVAVRVPFHLYYGWGALPITLWSLGLILCFLGLPVARVMPFVLAHICWDLPEQAKWALFVVVAIASPMLCAREDVRASNTLRAGWLLLTMDRRAGLQPESAGRVVGEDAAAADVPRGRPAVTSTVPAP